MDKADIHIVTKQNDNKLPSRVIFAGKTYFIIFVSIPSSDTTSASTRRRIEKITFDEAELTSEVST